jgi:DNA polymerase-3 subunit alpha
VEQLSELGPNQEVLLGGMLTQVRYLNTKKARNGNSRYVRCKLEDFTGAVECVMWPDDFLHYKEEIAEDRVCFVKAAVERTREAPGLILSRVFSIAQAERELTKGVSLLLKLGEHVPFVVDQLALVLRSWPGSCPVFLDVVDSVGKWCRYKVNEEFHVQSGAVQIEELEAILGRGTVRFLGTGNGKK